MIGNELCNNSFSKAAKKLAEHETQNEAERASEEVGVKHLDDEFLESVAGGICPILPMLED